MVCGKKNAGILRIKKIKNNFAHKSGQGRSGEDALRAVLKA